MKKKTNILYLQFKNYNSEITAKRLNTLMLISIIILFLLILSDIYNRHNPQAVYTRILPLSIAIFLFLYNKIQPKNSVNKIVLYNIFLSAIPVMMFAKYLVHYGTNSNMTNVIGIIVAISIISLEVRANLFYSLLIYFIPTILFTVILTVYYPINSEDINSIINIFIITIVGFFINKVQNNFRFKTYKSNYLLIIEKKKLEDAITELNQYKEKLEEMVEKKTITLKYALEKAKESDALKTQFLLNISHELRTPMNAVLGFSNILTRKNPELKKETEIIEKNLNTLLQTIENIILLSQLQSGQAGPEISKFSVKTFNKKIFNSLKKYVKNNKKQISVIIEDNLEKDFFIFSDFNKTEILFRHIFDNAVKYTESGTIKIKCEKISENEIQYIISDTGIGISHEELPHIFDTFRKAEKKEILYRGTGIGLSISKYLTELLQGNIKVLSKKNEGTSIILNLKTSIRK